MPRRRGHVWDLTVGHVRQAGEELAQVGKGIKATPPTTFNQRVRSAFVRRRIAASQLGIIIEGFVVDLHTRGHVLTCIQSYAQVVEHFSRWLTMRRLAVEQIDDLVVERFLHGHLPHCHCLKPAGGANFFL
jgi:hypothetical protein